MDLHNTYMYRPLYLQMYMYIYLQKKYIHVCIYHTWKSIVAYFYLTAENHLFIDLTLYPFYLQFLDV